MKERATRISLRELVRLAVVIVFFTAAPTAGDIGSCGQARDDLDPKKFFAAKAALDCQRCGECGIVTSACDSACTTQPQESFLAGCFPVVHDGEVCLDTLRAASCGKYASFEADVGATAPTECDFCPPEDQP
jgi:hypothetical protein